MSSIESSEFREMTPSISATRRLEACLRIVIAIECLGLGGRYLFGFFETESDIYGWLFFDLGWSEPLAQRIDNFGAGLALVAGFMVCCIGWAKRRQWLTSTGSRFVRRVDQIGACWVAFWMLMIAVAQMKRTSVYAELSLAEHAVRYVAPMALALIGTNTFRDASAAPRLRTSQLAVWLLIIAASATFAAHGYKAIERYGPFTDLILLSDLQWTDLGWSQDIAERLLVAIGVADLLVAFLLVIARSRLAALYMAAWGFLTAASRMTAFGIDAWPETLIRIANGGVPLTIAIYWTISNRKS